MKKALIGPAIFVAATAAAVATPSGRYLWEGDMFITKVDSACGTGKTVGKMVQVVLQPANTASNSLPGNGNQDQLMIFDQLSTMYWVPASGTYLNKAASISNKGIDSGGYYTGSQALSSMTVSPQAPTRGDHSVTVSATLTDPSTKCTYSVYGQLVGPF